MPNGKPHDHPLTDILVHGIETYGAEADDLIRKIRDLSPGELDEWWNAHIGWTGDREQVLRAARTRHAELLQRAKVQGWETQ